MSLQGKVALVTGASSGIGRGIAERLAQEGASVIINYGKSADKAQSVVRTIESRGGKALAVQADVSRVEDIRRLFQDTLRHFGRIDIAIANSGMFNQKTLMATTEEDYDAMFALNAKGAFFTMQEAGTHLRDGGRIIFISTGATAMSFSGAAVYKGSKAAGEQFVKTLAKELGPRQITVNTVSPGFTETDMLPPDPTFRESGIKMSPLGRLGQPRDIADIVHFLVSEEGGWITGNNIQAGGGII
ncbi:MAG: SDR family oxidoreductase [Nitrospirales bacterium]|nr:SDR family oxidoreductase [Nitrospirales bacterium]